METERCKIKLNSPENIYFAGQQIKGQICLTLAKRTKIRGIKFRITGKGKCNWVEFLRRESQLLSVPQDKTNTRSIIYSSKETYLLEELYIFGSSNGRSMELEPGEHTYDLQYELDKNLPSSFSGSYGSIKYKTKFIIEKPWSLNEKYSLPITIVKTFLMPSTVLCPQRQDFFQVTKNIGVFGAGPISLAAKLPKSYAVRGEKLKLKVAVDNKSSTHIDRLKFSIKQIVVYYSQQPLCTKREQISKLFKKETGGIQKKSSREYEHELQVPSCQPSDTDFSQIIHIKYEVQVEVVLPGLYKNISVSLPFFVCSAEYNVSDGAAIGGMFRYPNPNISICSGQSVGSPSHSFYSDTNSIYSTTSDSTISEDSFQRNGSISGRNSFRHSIGFAEYVVPQGFVNAAGPSNQPNSDRSNSITIPSRSQQQYLPELPPSYEELFGETSSQSAIPTAPPISSPTRK